MYQNKDVNNDNQKNLYKIDNKKKHELSRANFKLGSSSADYKTIFQKDFEIKPPTEKNNIDVNSLRKNLRNHSFIMGDHSVDYMSDHNLRFSNPNVKKGLK